MLLSFSGFMLLSIFGSFVLLSCIDHVNAEPRVIHMKTKRNTRKGLHKRDISSDDEVTVTAQGLMWYSVNLTVGTPGSTVRVHIDTGSSITWMTSPEASNNETVGSPIFFTPTDSSTYKFKNGEFHMEYVDKTVVDGDYFTDDLMLQGMKMQNVELGLAKKGGVDGDGKVGGGVMGLGPDANRVNLLDEMVNQSLIKSHTFSLWLDTLEAGSGNVLFGGYDNAKFDGELGLIPVLPPQNSWTVYVAGVVVDHDGEQTTIDMEQFPVLLDSGTSWSSLPTAVFDPLADLLTAIKAEPDNDKSNAWLVPCDVRDRDGAGLYLQFGSTDGPWINIPFSMLAVSSDDQPQTDDGRQLCSFGFERGRDNDTSFLFGDTFLRSAYVFHDLDRMQIGIAQALSAVTEANYQEVSNQVDDVVSASSVEGATYSADAKITRARLPGDGAYSGSVSVVTVPTTTPTSLSGGIATTITVDKAKTDPPTTSSSATQTSSSAATPAAQEPSTLPVLILALCGSLLLMGAMIV